jgi:hypothetical protein
MKYSIKHDLLFFLQYLVLIIMWYWLFRDNPVIRFMAGFVAICFSLLILFRPQWFPNRPGISGRVFPDKIYNQFRNITSWMGILFGTIILIGYRITTFRSAGIIGLLFIIAFLLIYLYWIINSDKNERSANKGFWVFAISIFLAFCALSVWFITKGNQEITMFSETSPYPMMIFYALIGTWHYIVIRKKERQYT